jgi:uncharacterized protein (TIGR02246 family)
MRLAVAFLICSTASLHSQSSAPVEQLRQTWVKDLEARSLEASLALYAPDATFINPDGTHASTPEALRQLFTFVYGGFTAKIQLISRSTGGSGDLAFDSGSYTETVTEVASDPGKGVHHLSGDYLTVYRREPDGRWQIVQQAWTEARKLAGT